MQILVVAIVAALVVLLIPRFLGGSQDRMLKQFEVLEKRFNFQHRVSRSKWGKGIGEHHSLSGAYRGYPFSLYPHFIKRKGKRRVWTSLVAEVLFIGEVELRIDFKGAAPEASFGDDRHLKRARIGEGWRARSDQEGILSVFDDERLKQRLHQFSRGAARGAIRLSKGFAEYREVGLLESDTGRLRFQEAILLMGDLADALSIYAGQNQTSAERC